MHAFRQQKHSSASCIMKKSLTNRGWMFSDARLLVVAALVWFQPGSDGQGLALAQPAARDTQPAAKQQAGQAAEDPYAWKSLLDGKTLKGWKSPNFGGEGEVTVKDGIVRLAAGNDMTGITCTGKAPKNNFEIALEGKRISGNDFFATTTFPVGDTPCSFVVGGWAGSVIGLSSIDGYDASENPTSQVMDFKNGQWYRIRIRVTSDKVEAWIDDQRVVDQERAGHRFSVRGECDLCQPLGVCSWCTEAGVRNIRIRQLRPEEVAAAEKKE
jgi:hypothetical protein